MKKTLGVVSDTHGNLEFLRRAAERLEEMGAEMLLHLGDDAADVQQLALPLPVQAVCGKYEPAYARGEGRVLELELAGWRAGLAHLPEDLPRAEILLHGHTHRPAAQAAPGSLLLCPGHLKAPADKGAVASFALISLAEDRLEASIFPLEGAHPLLSLVLRKGQA